MTHTNSELDHSSNIVFIDTSINNYQALVSGIEDAEVVLLDSSSDGIEQITEQLSNYSQLDSIQVISHGEEGNLQLGNTFLNQSSLADYADELEQWGNSLNSDGDLLFYGCNLAAGADGLALVEEISLLTNADVAASNDLTGNFSLGGDWTLEVATGQIETQIFVNQATQISYQDQLNLLANGSFEANAVEGGRWENFEASTVEGWQSLNGERIEIWDSGHNGVASPDGTNHAELDYNGGSNLDAIYQDIQTEDGRVYNLTFDMRSRSANFNSEDEAIYVEWNGVAIKADGYRATAAGQWTTISVEVTGTGGSDRLTLRESAEARASNGLGALLDNVVLEASGATPTPVTPPEIIEPPEEITPPEVVTPPATNDSLLVNGSFEANAVEGGRWAVFAPAQVPGWQSLNGESIEIWDNGHSGVASPDGTNHAELDYNGGSNLDAIYQDIQTEAGRVYNLTFDMRSRSANFNSEDEAIYVEWNGVATKADGYRATAAGQWTTISVEVTGTGGSDRLTLRESADPEASNGLGALLDNVQLTASDTVVTPPEVVEPPVVEPTPPVVEPPVVTPTPPVDIPNGNGFSRETLVSGLDNPIAFTYADDGRIFVTEKAGLVKIVENGQVTSTFIDINAEVNSYWDRGLMGIALDPDFAENGWVYLSYSVDLEPETPDRADFGSAAGGRLIRVKASAEDPNLADLSSREVILDGHKMTHATHAVGDVDFDNDGNLIFSWGDGGFGDNLRFEAQDPDSKQGKFFRVDPDTGHGVPGNPFYDPANPDSTRSKVLALGVRNPWRWTIDRSTGDIYFGEVTDGGPEEINIIHADITDPDKQLNFGWPYYEDNNRTRYGEVPDNFVYQDAYVALPHTGNLDAITGGAVYRGSAYPEQYDGRYFFANFYQGLYTADADGNFQEFGNSGDYSGTADIQLAPNGTIQYLSMFDGALYQLNYDANDVPLAPSAEATASATAGIGSLTVDFNSAGSSSPNGSTLSYAWDFESDGTIDSTVANPSHTYNVVDGQAATLSIATLTVTDEAGQQDTTEVEITVARSQPNDGNIAFGKPTTQSSTFAGALSSRAVDGNFDANSANGSVAVTTREDKAFWEIDLGAVYDLSSIMFYIGEEPLSDYYILVSENEFTGGNLSALLEEDDVWSFNDPDEAVDAERIPINQRGRYLRVQLAETNSLALAEVRIFGELV